MTHKSYKINTVEELVKFVAENPNFADTKWQLHDSAGWTWADEDAGKAWEKEISDFRNAHVWHPNITTEERAAYNAAEEAIYARKPKMKKGEIWVLNAKLKSWQSSVSLVLAPEIGCAIDSIWPMKPAYKGATYEVRTTNGLTLKSVLKRLGQSDIKAAIADAKEKAEIERRKKARNIARRHVSNLAKEIRRLEAEIAKIKNENPHIDWPASLEEMINIELEA